MDQNADQGHNTKKKEDQTDDQNAAQNSDPNMDQNADQEAFYDRLSPYFFWGSSLEKLHTSPEN